jgi:glucose/mannose-6-phosphate isomerase
MKINPLDKENLRQVILDSSAQFQAGFNLAKDIKVPGKFSAICISGMGGSALPVDVADLYLRATNIANKKFEIILNRNYVLPPQTFQNCLHFVFSFSGNTEESLSALQEIIRKKLPVVGIAHGGKLIEICRKHNLPFVELPFVSQPRYATGLFFSALLKILASSGFITLNESDILEKAKHLKKVTAKLESKGRSLARKLVGKTPLIYASDKFKALAMIWKIKINENAKTPAFYNVYPELSHNEMVGFTLPQGKFHVLTLLHAQDHPQIQKRMRLTAKLYKRSGIDTTLLEMETANIFASIFHTLALGDWISYYLALTYKQDPTPVKMVEDLKKMLV